MLSLVHGNADINASSPLIVKIVTNVSWVDRTVVGSVKLICNSSFLLSVLKSHEAPDDLGHLLQLSWFVYSHIRFSSNRRVVELKHKVCLESIDYRRNARVQQIGIELLVVEGIRAGRLRGDGRHRGHGRNGRHWRLRRAWRVVASSTKGQRKDNREDYSYYQQTDTNPLESLFILLEEGLLTSKVDICARCGLDSTLHFMVRAD